MSKKNNKKTSKPNVKPQQDTDHGPATVILVLPATRYKFTYRCTVAEGSAPADWVCVAKSREDADRAFSADPAHAGWKVLDVIEEPERLRELGIREPGIQDDKGVAGFMVVKSRTENFSVREIRVEPPVVGRKFVFHCVDVDGEEKTWSTSAASSLREASDAFYSDSQRAAWLVDETEEKTTLLRGPRLTSVRAVQFTCPQCGQRVMDRYTVLESSTREAYVEVRKDNGKAFRKRIRVAKDDGAEIHTLRDLDGHRMNCPVCGDVISDIKGKVWRLQDREVVPDQGWEDRIRKLAKEAPAAPHSSFADAIPRVVGVRADIGHRPTWDDLVGWDDLRRGNSVGSVWVQYPETFVFVLDDAQKLDAMSFGSRDDRTGYSGNIGFKPRRIRPESEHRNDGHSKPLITVGEAVGFDFGDGVVVV